MKKMYLIISGCLMFLTGLMAEEFKINAEANDKFITLMLHGFLAEDPTGQFMASPRNLFFSNFELVSYLRGSDNGPYSNPDIGAYTNISHFTFTDGWGRGLPEFPHRPIKSNPSFSKPFLNYVPKKEKKYQALSDIFIEELGDFNSGSRFLREYKQQCFIQLAKSEWVYRNSPTLIKNGQFEKIVKELLLYGPDFIDLLTDADFLLGMDTADNPIFVNGKALTNKLILLIDPEYGYLDMAGLRPLAEELVALAKQAPNIIRILTHSMGGMYAMRYLSESETKFYTHEAGGYYQRNLDYSFQEFLEDVYGKDEYPGPGEPGLIPKDYYKTLILYMRDKLARDPAYFSCTEKEREEVIYYQIFKPERQNAVDKLTTQDSPLEGNPGTANLEKAAAILGTEDGWNKYKAGIVSAIFPLNVWFSCFLLVSSVYLSPALSTIAFEYGRTSLIIDAGLLTIVMGTVWENNCLRFFGLPVDIAGVLMKYDPRDPDLLLFEDAKDDSLLVKSYQNQAPPPFMNFEEKVMPLSNGKTIKSFFPLKATETYIDMHVFSVGAVPLMTNVGILDPEIIRGMLIFGLFQNYLAVKAYLEGTLAIVRLIELTTKGLFFEEHPVNIGLPILYDLLGANWDYSTVLVYQSSSDGKEIKPVKNNPNATIYSLEVKPKGWSTLKRVLEGNINPVPGNYFHSQKQYNDMITNTDWGEYFCMHNYTRNLVQYPILCTENNPELLRVTPGKLIFFKDLFLWKTISIEHPYGQKNIQSQNEQGFPDYKQISLNNLNNPLYPEYLTRNLFYYTNFSFTQNTTISSGRTPASLTFSTKNMFNNVVTFYRARQSTPDRGLYVGYIGEDNEQIENAVDYVIFNNNITVLPFAITSYYPGLKFQYSINGNSFMDPVPLPSSYKNLQAYTAARQENEQAHPEMVHDQDGNTILSSPRFKEGYNTFTIRFFDPAGRTYLKHLTLMQNTIPPFVRPVYPLMNQYLGKRSFEAVVEALDIFEGAFKPETWFKAADFTILIDNNPVDNFTLHPENSTIRFNLTDLSDGIHTIKLNIKAYDLECAAGWNFWVDTTAPKITFPERLVFSNIKEQSSVGVAAFINDSLPFNVSGLDYPADTVFLSKLDIEIRDKDTIIKELFSSKETRLGAYAYNWDGKLDEHVLPHGKYRLCVNASDRVGNTNYQEKEIIIDTLAPALENLSLNTERVNLQSELLKINYRLGLDEWEKTGYLDISLENTDSNEKFKLQTNGTQGVDLDYILTYFVGGINVFKDGIYKISVQSRDELNNVSTPVVYQQVVVDRTRPQINQAYINPFVRSTTIRSTTVGSAKESRVTLRFSTDEKNDVTGNLSSMLPLTVKLVNQYGGEFPGYTAYHSSVIPGNDSVVNLDLPGNLQDGKYFLEITVTDKNGNSAKELAAFIINAMPPEITSPVENTILDGIVTLYGNIYDPRWDNELKFSHYALYYQTGMHEVPPDLNALSAWRPAGLMVPAYQKKEGTGKNRGHFTVEGNNIIGILDTTELVDGLITLLVVAFEQGGYKIGTVKSYRILKDNWSQGQSVQAQFNPPDTRTPLKHDFALDGDFSLNYEVTHGLDNPVDIHTFVKDATGRVVRQKSFYKLPSHELRGTPVIQPQDKGVFVYQTETGYFYFDLRNNAQGKTDFLLVLDANNTMSDFIDGLGDPLDVSPFINTNGHTLLFSKVLEQAESFRLGFRLPQGATLAITAMNEQKMADVYLGRNRVLSTRTQTKVYAGSDYPPILWDGKNEFGHYVENGVYIIGVEAFGEKNGYGLATRLLTITTPLAGSSLLAAEAGNNPPSGDMAATYADHLDPTLKATLLPFEEEGVKATFRQKDLVKGDMKYQVAVTAQGQYLPDREVSLDIEATGTQMVEAYPDINYMVAFRTNYQELLAELTVQTLKIQTRLVKWFGRNDIRYDYHTYYPEANYPPVSGEVVIYNLDTGTNTETLTTKPLKFDGTITAVVPIKYEEICGLFCHWWSFDGVMELAIGEAKITKGNLYMGKIDIEPINTSWSWISSTRTNGNWRWRDMQVTISFTGTASVAGDFDKQRYLSYADGIAVMSPDIKTITAYAHKTDFANKGRGSYTYRLIKDPHLSTGMDVLSKEEVWREKPRFYVYYLGEDYASGVNDTRPYHERVNLNGYEIDESGIGGVNVAGKLKILKALQVPRIPVPEGDLAFSAIVADKAVRFKLDKIMIDPVNALSSNAWALDVTVSTDAQDRILLQYPENEAVFNESHHSGVPHLNVPDTLINGTRSNDGNSITNYLVPVMKLTKPTEANVLFVKDVNNKTTINTTMQYQWNKDDPAESGYLAIFDLQQLNNVNFGLGENINIKLWKIKNMAAKNVVFFPLAPEESIIDNIALNQFFYLTDRHIDRITDSPWTFNNDNFVQGSVLSGVRKDIDLAHLNRYGRLQAEHFSDTGFYPFSSADSREAKNYLHVVGGIKADNPAVIVHPSSRDYSKTGLKQKYEIKLSGLDGKDFQGLEVKEIAYFGKDLKLNDGYILGVNKAIPRKLVAIRGVAEDKFNLAYLAEDQKWIEIPVCNPDPVHKILSYWDITGLSGLTTVRLISEVTTSGKTSFNFDLREVYIGEVVNTSTTTRLLTSAAGQITIVFPPDCLDEDTLMNIDTIHYATVKDIANLPELAPPGKIIKLSPDGQAFGDVKPQLHFTYNRTDLEKDAIDPRKLVIYHMAEDGNLLPLNTIKVLIKVNYASNGVIISEEAVWNSETGTNDEIEKLDYDYVRAWATIAHFSYYALFKN